MGKMKNKLMEMQDYAWHLMLDAELVKDGVADFTEAKRVFLLKYPSHEAIWASALEEYASQDVTVS